MVLESHARIGTHDAVEPEGVLTRASRTRLRRGHTTRPTTVDHPWCDDFDQEFDEESRDRTGDEDPIVGRAGSHMDRYLRAGVTPPQPSLRYVESGAGESHANWMAPRSAPVPFSGAGSDGRSFQNTGGESIRTMGFPRVESERARNELAIRDIRPRTRGAGRGRRRSRRRPR